MMRSFIVGYEISKADEDVFVALSGNPHWKDMKMTKYPNVVRWFTFLSTFERFKQLGISEMNQNKHGSLPDLPDAVEGKTVFRFAPEPSGYLHMGHCKAVFLNFLYTRKYKGKFILRFDDTNPTKEKDEYVNTITEDLAMLGIVPSEVTHASNYFEEGIQIIEKMIKNGKAYCDPTPVDEMRALKEKCLESAYRNTSVEENLRIWEEMKNGTDFGKTCVVRAKMFPDSPNGCLRDPPLYRVNASTPHIRTGNKYKVYPLYDFSCPLVDALEGVTHAFRSSEFHDRDQQYAWLQEAMGFKRNHVIDFSRINFKYQLLSKRKLQWFVDTGRVSGWDDPRFPTVRGILRHGLRRESLQEFILEQGFSKKTNLMDMSKLWSTNKSLIDPIVPRYTAVDVNGAVKVSLSGWDKGLISEPRLLHKKNPEMGEKQVYFNDVLLLEAADAKLLTEGEEITLIDWGNAIIETIAKDGDTIVEIKAKLHLEGDFKKTKYKLTWLAYVPEKFAKLNLITLDYLITKESLKKEDNFEDFVNPVTKYEVSAHGDHNLSSIKKGESIQLERKGYYICDADLSTGDTIQLIAIPDGRQKK